MGNTLVTSTALRAVQEKKISLDATINDYLKAWKSPQFPGGRPLTIRDLLENKSGLIYHKYFGYNPLEPVPTLLQVLRICVETFTMVPTSVPLSVSHSHQSTPRCFEDSARNLCSNDETN
jgi:CubicO group peptidase (beta-lactamase class C family)